MSKPLKLTDENSLTGNVFYYTYREVTFHFSKPIWFAGEQRESITIISKHTLFEEELEGAFMEITSEIDDFKILVRKEFIESVEIYPFDAKKHNASLGEGDVSLDLTRGGSYD